MTGNSEAIITDLTSALRGNEIGSAADLRTVLTDLARRYIDGVLRPNVLALRRLIIAEAERVPDLARTYFDQAPSRGIDVIARALRTYEERGLLDLGDARLAAAQFAYLVLGIPQDRAQFCPQERPSPQNATGSRPRQSASSWPPTTAQARASHKSRRRFPPRS